MRWKRSRRRGVSVGRIALLVVLLSAAGAYGVWWSRPVPVARVPVGAERIVTPAFDIAGEDARFAVRSLSGDGTEWLGASCSAESARETYVIKRSGRLGAPSWTGEPSVRVTAVFDALGRGVIVREEYRPYDDAPLARGRRTLDEDDAERFRDLLIEGGYARHSPWGMTCPDHPRASIESCIDGRYYGVVSGCGGEAPWLHRLVEELETFARDGAKPWPIVRPSPAPPPSSEEGVDTANGRE